MPAICHIHACINLASLQDYFPGGSYLFQGLAALAMGQRPYGTICQAILLRNYLL